jgi:hypothetical protein
LVRDPLQDIYILTYLDNQAHNMKACNKLRAPYLTAISRNAIIKHVLVHALVAC